MSKKVILEVLDDGNLYDASGIFIASTAGMNYQYFEPEFEAVLDLETDTTFKFIQQGVSVNDIIKLKDKGLI